MKIHYSFSVFFTFALLSFADTIQTPINHSTTCTGKSCYQIGILPEIYIGATLVSHEYSMGIGGNIAGGVRIKKRHFFGLDINITHNLGVSDDGGMYHHLSVPQVSTLFGMRASYYFAPLLIKDLFKLEAGFAISYGSDEYENYYGSWGIPARVSIGNNKIAYYIDGFANVSCISDLLGDFYNKQPYIASVSTGVRYQFGKRS